MKLINLQLNPITSAINIVRVNSCNKYPLKYQSKYFAHFTIFTEYRYKATSKGALLRKVLL